MKMRIIHPNKTGTYQVGFDDNCIVVSSGTSGEKKVWLSKSMIQWIWQNHYGIFCKKSITVLDEDEPQCAEKPKKL